MGRIKIMSDTLASQVAAGEVVERPASVVKELVENALDAGARSVEVKVEKGGLSLIRVVDDGCGMGRDDAQMALERHATSKISTVEDLAKITTMGFRGEALPSIASVSRFRLATREADSISGTEILIDGGEMQDVRDSGRAPGTEMEVRSLFYNVPARRKFMRAESTEFSHIEQLLRQQAIAHPEVRFTLIHGLRTVFQLPASSDIQGRIRGLVGDELASRLVSVPEMEHRGVKISGYVGRPGVGRSNRGLQMVFLNNRPIDSPAVSAALREAYRGALPQGRYPVTFLFLEVDPEAVDVNVHPAKREVRFRDGRSVHDAVFAGVTEALTMREESSSDRPVQAVSKQEVRPKVLIPEAEQTVLRNDWGPLAEQSRSEKVATIPGDVDVNDRRNDTSLTVLQSGEETSEEEVDAPPVEETESAAAEEDQQASPDFRFIGSMSRGMVLLESEEGLVILDRRAARERVIYEEARKRMGGDGVSSQRLLVPITAELPPKDFDLLIQNRDALAKLGVELEPFGAKTIKLESLPTFLETDDPLELVNQLVHEMREELGPGRGMRIADDSLAASVCRRAAGAEASPATEENVTQLLAQLFRCDLPYCCPRGNPTLVQMGYAELERKFGR